MFGLYLNLSDSFDTGPYQQKFLNLVAYITYFFKYPPPSPLQVHVSKHHQHTLSLAVNSNICILTYSSSW